MKSSCLSTEEFHSDYEKYIDLTDTSLSVEDILLDSFEKTHALLKGIPSEKWGIPYDKDKWTVKEIVQHLIDNERVFAYRAISFGRFDTVNLAGYDHNDYVRVSCANSKSVENLLLEYATLREATLSLFKSFDSKMLSSVGLANNKKMSVRAIAFIIAGHEKHHCEIINQRYL